ncbi:hypothetical protein MAPG_10010 [Magnaporthiopsis poae ATCC 64411]|uniref:Uncharacterized protein n=1 Tax=Magnaporthiopsis poae (strain ATCC 64411 / 73-15) TaxID=644358 RepID=A0A0C4EBG3_MAGP6|nr:hypothetical protein MAPG_10010 [Magnaporthiopsis poae ATCC 64411]
MLRRVCKVGRWDFDRSFKTWSRPNTAWRPLVAGAPSVPRCTKYLIYMIFEYAGEMMPFCLFSYKYEDVNYGAIQGPETPKKHIDRLRAGAWSPTVHSRIGLQSLGHPLAEVDGAFPTFSDSPEKWLDGFHFTPYRRGNAKSMSVERALRSRRGHPRMLVVTHSSASTPFSLSLELGQLGGGPVWVLDFFQGIWHFTPVVRFDFSIMSRMKSAQMYFRKSSRLASGQSTPRRPWFSQSACRGARPCRDGTAAREPMHWRDHDSTDACDVMRRPRRQHGLEWHKSPAGPATVGGGVAAGCAGSRGPAASALNASDSESASLSTMRRDTPENSRYTCSPAPNTRPQAVHCQQENGYYGADAESHHLIDAVEPVPERRERLAEVEGRQPPITGLPNGMTESQNQASPHHDGV